MSLRSGDTSHQRVVRGRRPEPMAAAGDAGNRAVGHLLAGSAHQPTESADLAFWRQHAADHGGAPEVGAPPLTRSSATGTPLRATVVTHGAITILLIISRTDRHREKMIDAMCSTSLGRLSIRPRMWPMNIMVISSRDRAHHSTGRFVRPPRRLDRHTIQTHTGFGAGGHRHARRPR